MQFFACPHCKSTVEIFVALSGQVVTCPHCGGQFQIPSAQPQAPPLPNQPNVTGYHQRVRRNAPRHWLVIGLVGLGIAAVVIGGLALLRFSQQSSLLPLAFQAKERRIVDAYLRENLGNPDYEVIFWEGPRVIYRLKVENNRALKIPKSVVRLKYRHEFLAGSRVVSDEWFFIEDGQVESIREHSGSLDEWCRRENAQTENTILDLKAGVWEIRNGRIGPVQIKWRSVSEPESSH